MKVVIQRVKNASVSIGGKIHASINYGFLILLGIHFEDKKEDVDWLVGKINALRIFSDNDGKMNLSIQDVSGEILVISQFTLYASYKKGNRPGFADAARPNTAIPLYEYFIQKASEAIGRQIATGVFGADMQVSLVNDGPVTIIMDTRTKE